MPRTTVDLDAAVLRDLKHRQKREGKALGQLISELVAPALAREKTADHEAPPFRWTARSMATRVDLEDKEAAADWIERGA